MGSTNKVANSQKLLEAVTTEVMEKTVEQTRASYDALNSKVSEAVEHIVKTISDVTEFTKGNVEAFVASAKAAQAGAETLTTAFVEASRKRFEDTQSAFKAFTSIKSPNELVQLQTNFAKSQFDQAVQSWSQLSEAMLKVSNEVMQPLSSRAAVAAETLKKTTVSA
ncbi:MAG: phasin family protein [Sphingomonadaceae bacterium]